MSNAPATLHAKLCDLALEAADEALALSKEALSASRQSEPVLLVKVAAHVPRANITRLVDCLIEREFVKAAHRDAMVQAISEGSPEELLASMFKLATHAIPDDRVNDIGEIVVKSATTLASDTKPPNDAWARAYEEYREEQRLS